MLSRRNFGVLGASAGLSLITVGETTAQGLTKIRMANASGVIDSQIIFLTAGMNPKLGFYKQEGLEKDIINMSGVSQTIQAVTTGNCEVSPVSPPGLLQVWTKNPTLDLICAYCWLRQVHWGIVVKPDSPLKTLAELKGKKIGIRNQGDTGFIGAKAMVREIGLDPDKDMEWIPINEGGPAGDSIYKGRVDAMAYWDGGIARVELAGFPLRYLPNTPGMQGLFGNSYAVRKSDLAKNKDVLGRYFRAMAKSTVFAHTNPEVSVKLAWEVFPETKPKGKTDDEAMKEAMHVVNSRKDKWLPGSWAKDKRWGAHSKEEWEAQVKFAGLEAQVKDVSPFFTNELLDEVNKFDAAAIVKMAKEFKI